MTLKLVVVIGIITIVQTSQMHIAGISYKERIKSNVIT